MGPPADPARLWRTSTGSNGWAARVGPYALQAAIAACHARATVAEDTDWERITALYDGLARISPSPIVELNRGVGSRSGIRPRGRPRDRAAIVRRPGHA